MSLTQEEWQAVKDLRDCMAELRDFCAQQDSITGSCCNELDSECPISRGEWWGSEENEKLKRVSSLLFPDTK